MRGCSEVLSQFSVNRSVPRNVLGGRQVAPPREDEFVSFYEAHWPKLVAALTWSVPDGEDPTDVAQEAFARAYQRWSRLQEHPRPDAWLFLTAFRIALSLGRRLTVRRRYESVLTASQPDHALEGIEVDDLLSTIPARERAALLLRHYYGLSNRETARALACREGTVKSLLARARERLKRAVADGELGA
jgi:RNA polymerase sigma-70 factor (ECF subfamily)